jgi:hypothetical protein
MMSDWRSPADKIADELDALRAVPTVRTPLLRAIGPLADSDLVHVRIAVARVYATLPLDPRQPAGERTIEAVRELAGALEVRLG